MLTHLLCLKLGEKTLCIGSSVIPRTQHRARRHQRRRIRTTGEKRSGNRVGSSTTNCGQPDPWSIKTCEPAFVHLDRKGLDT